MNAEKPAKGIMKTGEYDMTEGYYIACDCHSTEHAVEMWIEVNKDDDLKAVSVEFFANMSMPIWQEGFSRIRAAWDVLIHGNYTQSHCMLLNKQTALTLAETIRETVERLDNASSDR